MTLTPGAEELLAALRHVGVALFVVGDKIRFTPRDIVSDEQIQRLRKHKWEIVTHLASRDSACPRCHASEFRNAPIHGGASVRRDCVRCGRFVSFPIWYGVEQAADSTPAF